MPLNIDIDRSCANPFIKHLFPTYQKFEFAWLGVDWFSIKVSQTWR